MNLKWIDQMLKCGKIASTEPSEPPVAHPEQEFSMSHVAVLEAGVPAEHMPIYLLEGELLKLPQVPLPIDHAFCAGLYARTMHIPAGTILTGAVHREESFFLVRKGDLIVSTDTGPQRLGPGDMSISKIGTKRAGIALTDVEITTFHANPTNEQEPQKLWDLFTIPAPSLEAVRPAQLEEST